MRALRYFKKELERYADVTSAAGKIANFTPTISPIALSLHTVEELRPYREQFLAAGLAVTSADQGAAKGKMVQSKPEQVQVDDKGRATYSSSSFSSMTIIHFEAPDSVNMALIDELPVRKTKGRKRKTRTRSILPWFCKKPTIALGTSPSAQGGQAQDMLGGAQAEDVQGAQAPGLIHKSPMRHVKKHGLRDNRGHSGVRPSPPKQPPPPVPSKGAEKDPRRTKIRLRHRTIITRVPDDDNNAQPGPSRSKSPSHVRNRHLPVIQPATKKRLSTKLEEAEEILAEDSNTGKVIEAKPMEDLPPQNKTSVARQLSDEPLVRARPRIPKKDLVSPTLELTPSNRPQYSKKHSFSPTPPAMIKKSTELSPVLPITWQYAVGTPSSFEQALDDVVRKLDEIESKPVIRELEITLRPEARRQDAKQVQSDVPHLSEASPAPTEQKKSGDGDPKPSQMTTTDTSSSSFAYHRLQRAAAIRRQRIAAEDGAQSSQPPGDAVCLTPSDIGPSCPSPASDSPQLENLSTSDERIETAKLLSVKEVVVDHPDRDIADRDVLKGLKLAINAACDENLDAWMRGKTGLRLRRFLADLKAFDTLNMEGQIGTKGTAKKHFEGKVDAGDAEVHSDTTRVTAKATDKATDKGRAPEWHVQPTEAGQPAESIGKSRSSAGIRRHGRDQNEVEEPENRRTSAGARRPEPESSDHEARTPRGEQRTAQAEKGTEKERKHKHLLRAEA